MPVLARLLLLAGAAPLVLVAAAADRHADELAKLPRCAAVRSETRPGWSETAVRDRFSLRLPPGCRHEAQQRYVHGGDRWQCGSVGVEVVWGMWGAGSFPQASAKCGADIAGLPVMVVRDQDKGARVIVWYPIGDVHEPLVSAWSSRAEDVPLLESIVFSGRVRPAQASFI